MDSLKSWMAVHLFLFLLLPLFSYSSLSSNPSVNLYQTWNNNYSAIGQSSFPDGSAIRTILVGSTDEYTNTTFWFGFFANRSTSAGEEDSFYLVIGLLREYDGPVVLWCANRDKPVSEYAALHFTAQGGLELEDVDGTLVWSTNTSGASVTRFNISGGGNLMLLDGKDDVIWQSFDYPTDTWLPDQKIKRLASSNSSSNLGTGLYSLAVARNNSLVAFTNSDPPQYYLSVPIVYFESLGEYSSIQVHSNYALFKDNRTVNLFQCIRLEPNGHVNVYQFPNYDEPDTTTSYNLFSWFANSDCDYPTVCGNYGLCKGSRNPLTQLTETGISCSCPSGYFAQLQDWEPSLGCRPITPLSCKDKHLHSFLELKEVTYFNFETSNSKMDIESCKRACLDNCTCKAALFSYGRCSLQSQLYSLKYNASSNFSAFIKVQNQAEKNRLWLQC